jgi:ATP:ADP antiporter, AAA family
MNKTRKRFLNLRPGEPRLVFILGFLLLGNSLAMQVSGIVAVSGFLDSGGVNGFLLIYLVDAVLLFLLSSLLSLVIDKFNRIKLMGWVTLAYALIFILLRIMFLFNLPDALNYSLMYIVSDTQFFSFPLIFWVMANDAFKVSQTKRLFPLISAMSFIGILLGIGVAYASPTLFANLGIKSEEILILNALIYLIGYILLITGTGNVKLRETVHRSQTIKETLTEGWHFVKDVPAYRYLMFIILAMALSYTIVEFRFFMVTDNAFTNQAAYQTFYSLFRLGVTVAAFLLQTFLTSRIIKSIQLKNAFMILPVTIFTSVIGLLISPLLAVGVGAMSLVRLVRISIDETTNKSFQAFVPEERRGRVSTFMDSYMPTLGIILACVLVGGIVLIENLIGQNLHLVYLGLAAGFSGAAIWAALQIRKVYDASLLNWRMKRRQRGSSVLDKLSDL